MPGALKKAFVRAWKAHPRGWKDADVRKRILFACQAAAEEILPAKNLPTLNPPVDGGARTAEHRPEAGRPEKAGDTRAGTCEELAKEYMRICRSEKKYSREVMRQAVVCGTDLVKAAKTWKAAVEVMRKI